MTTPAVEHHAGAGQFEIRTASGTALLRYLLRGDRLDAVHTEVPSAFQGQGYGEALARAAFDYAREAGLKVIPTCPFVKQFAMRHPELADLVAEGTP